MTLTESTHPNPRQTAVATLEMRNLNKTFSPTVIPVKNLNLSVDKGEFLTLLGPSGCGKSTVLRMIAGLEQPTQGQMLLEGKDVTRLGPGDRNMSMVFQSYALYPHMTVADNIASGLKLRKVPRNEIEERIQDVSEFLGLKPLLNRRPSQLSGGQRQRVAVARALVRRPSVFLLDEPLSNLDALLREQVRAELKQLFEDQQAPVVYVTHDQTEAMTLSTKVAILNEGYLQQVDAPHRIYTHPANRFVAGFVGSPQMNFLTLPCDGQTAVLGRSRIPLPKSVPGNTRQITLGVRPEHVQVVQAEGRPVVSGDVFLVENLGMHNLISVCITDVEERPTIRLLLPPDRHPRGKHIGLTFLPRELHWFDAETGEAYRD